MKKRIKQKNALLSADVFPILKCAQFCHILFCFVIDFFLLGNNYVINYT